MSFRFFGKSKDPSKPLIKKAPPEAKRLLSEANLKDVAAIFLSLSKDGVVSRDTFTQSFFPEFQNLSNAFFDAFDANHDGSLDWSEFALGLTLCNARSSKEEKLEVIFRMFDSDGNRLVGKEEMRRLLKTSFFRASHIKRAFRELDDPSSSSFLNLPSTAELDRRVDDLTSNAFYHYAVSSHQGMTHAEFREWALESWDVDQLLLRLVDPAPAKARTQASIDSIKALVRQHPEVAAFFRGHAISPAVLIRDLDMLKLVISLLGADIQHQARRLSAAPASQPNASSPRASDTAHAPAEDPADILRRWPPGAICWAEAIFPYAAQADSDLSIRPGQRMFITSQSPTGWWLAALDGAVGYVPANYIRPLLFPPNQQRIADPCASPARQLAPVAPPSAPAVMESTVSPSNPPSTMPHSTPLSSIPSSSSSSTSNTTTSNTTSTTSTSTTTSATTTSIPPSICNSQPLPHPTTTTAVPSSSSSSEPSFPLDFQPSASQGLAAIPPPIAVAKRVLPPPPPPVKPLIAHRPLPVALPTSPTLRPVPAAPQSAPPASDYSTNVMDIIRNHPKFGQLVSACHDTPPLHDFNDDWD